MISAVLHYTTNELRFLDANLKQASKFCNEIVIPICSHFFSGEPEDEKLIKESLDIISKYPKCIVKRFKWQGPSYSTTYHHNYSRKVGTDLATNKWILMLDADEIIDDNFGEWFDSIKNKRNGHVLTCNFYFREPIYKAIQRESAGLLILKEDCIWRLHDSSERQQLYQKLWEEDRLNYGDINPVLGLDGNVLLHHYSWVRTKEQMLKKVKNWGHKNDRNWIDLVEEEFSREFNGIDFVHGYTYETIENKFNI